MCVLIIIIIIMSGLATVSMNPSPSRDGDKFMCTTVPT